MDAQVVACQGGDSRRDGDRTSNVGTSRHASKSPNPTNCAESKARTSKPNRPRLSGRLTAIDVSWPLDLWPAPAATPQSLTSNQATLKVLCSATNGEGRSDTLDADVPWQW